MKQGKLFHQEHHREDEFKHQPIHSRLRNGCMLILGSSPRLKDLIYLDNVQTDLDIRHPADLLPCFLEVTTPELQYKATLHLVRAPEITLNGFDIANDYHESLKLLNQLQLIYKYYYND